MILLIFSIY